MTFWMFYISNAWKNIDRYDHFEYSWFFFEYQLAGSTLSKQICIDNFSYFDKALSSMFDRCAHTIVSWKQFYIDNIVCMYTLPVDGHVT